MTLEILREHLFKRPFTPFRVVSSSGQAYEVRHPENAILIKGGLVVAHGGDDGGLPDRAATLSLLHIAAVEEIRDRASRRRG